jgi:hypothetical protein
MRNYQPSRQGDFLFTVFMKDLAAVKPAEIRTASQFLYYSACSNDPLHAFKPKNQDKHKYCIHKDVAALAAKKRNERNIH